MIRPLLTCTVVLAAAQHLAALTEENMDHITSVPGAVVIEGESPRGSNFVVDTLDPLFVRRAGDTLQRRAFDGWHGGGAGLLLTTRPGTYRAVYAFSVNTGIDGALWVFEQGRPWASPFRWRIDKGTWHDVPVDLLMQNPTRVGRNGPTFGWCRLGEANLAPGEHELEIEVTEPRQNGTYLLSQDCFMIVPPQKPGAGPPFNMREEHPSDKAVWLWESHAPGSEVYDDFRPWLEPYLVKGRRARGAVVICPGGAYVGRAPHEGEPVARTFNEQGLHAFVVHYRTAPHHHPAPYFDATRAMRIVREHAREWKVKPGKIALCGFSAGGHLAATVGVHPGKWRPDTEHSIDTVSARPDALILCYPVISSGEFGHERSFENLLGPEPPSDILDLLSPERYVDANTPPAFLWHTAMDGVRVENSLVFAKALRAQDTPFELHVYAEGGHGMNIAEDNPHVGSWVKLCVEWLHGMGW